MFKQIPKKLLIHSVLCVKKSNKDKFGKCDILSKIKINNVRIEFVNKQVLSKTNTQTTLSALLFYDVKNSHPPHNFVVGDEIVFNNQNYIIETVEEIYTNKLHHLEIGLKI